jgi:hypothetical protein
MREQNGGLLKYEKMADFKMAEKSTSLLILKIMVFKNYSDLRNSNVDNSLVEN